MHAIEQVWSSCPRCLRHHHLSHLASDGNIALVQCETFVRLNGCPNRHRKGIGGVADLGGPTCDVIDEAERVRLEDGELKYQ